MIRLLDTNTCIYFLNEKSEKLIKQSMQMKPADIKLPAIRVAKLYFGAEKSKAKVKKSSKSRAVYKHF